MNRSNDVSSDDLSVHKVSVNLAMFEYIDELLHSEPDSLSIKQTNIHSQDLESDQNTLEIENPRNETVIAIDEIKNSQTFQLKKTIFKEPVLKPYLQSNLLTIEKDLSVSFEDVTRKKDSIEVEKKEIPEEKESELNKKFDQASIVSDPDNAVSESEINEEINNSFDESALRNEKNFDCVMVKIDSLLIALPMAVLGTINKIENEPTKLPSKPKWFLGIHNVDKVRRYNLIDTQDVLFSEEQKKKLKNKEGIRRFSINVFGTNWALACDEVIGSIRVESNDVKWRNDEKHQIVSGTLKTKMCMLINVTKLINQVTKQNVLNDL